jgi:hypothetical protein
MNDRHVKSPNKRKAREWTTFCGHQRAFQGVEAGTKILNNL